jgi:ubiquinone/menaquinone biosynthesis C-methylase UbiE
MHLLPTQRVIMGFQETIGKNDISRIQKYYDAEAQCGAYENMYDTPLCRAETFALRSVLTGQLDGEVLDIGCGDGELYGILPPDGPLGNVTSYTGIDVSHVLLKNARNRYPKIRVANADMHNLPYESDKFDALISLYGPFSYSLNPQILLDEFDRVTKPSGQFFVMPYTLRTGCSIELGGESTAVEPSIQKIFYTSELAHKVFSRYPEVTVRGMNYFANTLNRLLNENAIQPEDITPEIFPSLLKNWAQEMGVPCPDLDPCLFTDLASAWQTNPRQTDMDFLQLLLAEQDIAPYIPAEFARHMYVFVKRGKI